MAAPMSLFAETRSARRTELQGLADELSRVLGSGRVEVAGRTAVPQQSSMEDAVIAAIHDQVFAKIRSARGAGNAEESPRHQRGGEFATPVVDLH